MKTKTTDGLYKRLKKNFIDETEQQRKTLTGGKFNTKKLEQETVRISHRNNAPTYTHMELSGNILTGNLSLALDQKQKQRLPKSFYMTKP